MILADLPVKADRIRPVAHPLVGARRLADRLYTLPTHRGVSHRDMEAVGWLIRSQRSSTW